MRRAALILVFGFFATVARAQTFEVAEASITDLQQAMTQGRVTSKALVQAYLNRIEAFDKHGPRLNAIITLNPNALKEAEALDRERAAKGPRGPLHGVPVLVKDNYGTADMQTTAGTMALLGFVPSQDAFQVKKLRDAGAVILGKTNLHELASGIVTVGSAFGQTLNPYDPSRNPGGSSGGTGAAIASSFAAVGMGSDTCGSIRIPSSFNNLVGLRPTKGLSSINGIVPLSTTQDVGGPLARSVTDLAIVLDATIGEDPGDAATHLKSGQIRPKFMDMLKADSLPGVRIGILEPIFGDANDDQDVIRAVRAGLDQMKAKGAIVESIKIPEWMELTSGVSVIDLEFKEDLAAYLAKNDKAPVHSLQEILDKGLYHVSLDGGLRRRVTSKGRDSDEYRKAIAKQEALRQAMLKIMDDQKLNALVYPTMRRKPAHIGDAQPGTTCQLSASTGFPAISIPVGFTADGLPVGMELLGRPFDDGKLVSYAYAYEQATHPRRAPVRTPALSAVKEMTWDGKDTRASAHFGFDPTTNNLRYTLKLEGVKADDVLSATIHRGAQGATGPVILVLSNHGFTDFSGVQELPAADRERLVNGGLYLAITTRAHPEGEFRVQLKP